MEQLKGIKKELGTESDGKDKLIGVLKARAEQLAMPEPVKRAFEEELTKLAHLELATTSTGSRRFPGVNAHARTVRSDTPRRF